MWFHVYRGCGSARVAFAPASGLPCPGRRCQCTAAWWGCSHRRNLPPVKREGVCACLGVRVYMRVRLCFVCVCVCFLCKTLCFSRWGLFAVALDPNYMSLPRHYMLWWMAWIPSPTVQLSVCMCACVCIWGDVCELDRACCLPGRRIFAVCLYAGRPPSPRIPS